MLPILNKHRSNFFDKIGFVMAAILKCVMKLRLITEVSSNNEFKNVSIQVSKTTEVI